MTLKLHQMQALIALVDKGSIRGAARALGVTQPALSSRIAELEQEVGATLVNRTIYGTTLTSVGRALLVHARTIDNHVRRATEEMALLSHQGVATLSVGASALAAIEIVAPILEDLHQHHPDVHLDVKEGQFHEMSVELREGALDFVIAPIPRDKPAKTFHCEELVTYDMHIVARVRHPLRRSATLRELDSVKWIVGAATSSTRSTVEELYLEQGLAKPTITVRSDAITLVQAALATSDLMALLPSPLFAAWPDKICVVPIVDQIRPLRLALISLAGVPLSPLAERFAGLVRDRAQAIASSLASKRKT